MIKEKYLKVFTKKRLKIPACLHLMLNIQDSLKHFKVCFFFPLLLLSTLFLRIILAWHFIYIYLKKEKWHIPFFHFQNCFSEKSKSFIPTNMVRQRNSSKNKNKTYLQISSKVTEGPKNRSVNRSNKSLPKLFHLSKTTLIFLLSSQSLCLRNASWMSAFCKVCTILWLGLVCKWQTPIATNSQIEEYFHLVIMFCCCCDFCS